MAGSTISDLREWALGNAVIKRPAMALNLLQNKQTNRSTGEAGITPRCFSRAEEAKTQVRHHLSVQQKQLFTNPHQILLRLGVV